MRLVAILVLAIFVASAVSIGVHRSAPVQAASVSPAAGWTIHIDALKHFKNHPDEVAHHWCRPLAAGNLECQIYPSDTADAPLVATEMIVPTATWQAMPASEQRYWHYHKIEIPKVSPKMPDMSPEDAKALGAKLMETYGKVYVLWDPMDGQMAAGDPYVNILQ